MNDEETWNKIPEDMMRYFEIRIHNTHIHIFNNNDEISIPYKSIKKIVNSKNPDITEIICKKIVISLNLFKTNMSIEVK